MKNYILAIALIVVTTGHIFAKEGDTVNNWVYAGVLQLNVQQLRLENWQGGGENTLALGGYTDWKLSYVKDKYLWSNYLKASLGSVKQGGKEQPFIKSDDNIQLGTKYTYEINKPWYFVGLADLQTYILPGYVHKKDSTGRLKRENLLSEFFSPAYMIAALGFEYKPTKNFYAMISPLSTKFTFVQNDSMSKAGAFGVDPGKHFRAEMGATFKSIASWDFMKNAQLKNEIRLFGDYKNLKAIDINEQLQLILKANKHLSAKFTADFIYDQDVDVTRKDGSVGPAAQFKEAILLGFEYTI